MFGISCTTVIRRFVSRVVECLPDSSSVVSPDASYGSEAVVCVMVSGERRFCARHVSAKPTQMKSDTPPQSVMAISHPSPSVEASRRCSMLDTTFPLITPFRPPAAPATAAAAAASGDVFSSIIMASSIQVLRESILSLSASASASLPYLANSFLLNRKRKKRVTVLASGPPP
ncbi:hypothetical protein PWT90_10988 [Aphanocladium album]|nr:hypothetical protein PWT90_10988 [Aphanocladium album]